MISVQVCYVAPNLQFLRAVRLAQGSTVQDAIEGSGLLGVVSDLDMRQVKVGIYSKLKTPDTVLKSNDRVEVYRPLLVDPMMARRARAKKKQASAA